MRIRVAHLSLQFSDSDAQHTEDIEKLFKRAVDRRYGWITGTESGKGAGNTSKELIRVARANGYRPWVPELQGEGFGATHTDCWIAVREDLIKGDWTRGFREAIPGSKQLEEENPELPTYKSFGPRGVVHVGFDSLPALGHVSVGTAHYIADSHNPDAPWWEWNRKLAHEIGEWAKEEGAGSALVFYGGDQNMKDDRNDAPEGDSFFGEPLTTVWDELRKWDNTGHGTIDVIATYNKDGRVSALKAHALNDSEFRLHGDHFLVEATLTVAPL